MIRTDVAEGKTKSSFNKATDHCIVKGDNNNSTSSANNNNNIKHRHSLLKRKGRNAICGDFQSIVDGNKNKFAVSRLHSGLSGSSAVSGLDRYGEQREKLVWPFTFCRRHRHLVTATGLNTAVSRLMKLLGSFCTALFTSHVTPHVIPPPPPPQFPLYPQHTSLTNRFHPCDTNTAYEEMVCAVLLYGKAMCSEDLSSVLSSITSI